MDLFSQAHEQANVWVKDVMRHLDSEDPHGALHALRAGLHAIRDRLTTDEAAQLSAQLPLVVRGLFFEGWDPGRRKTRLHTREEFLSVVAQHYRPREDRSGASILDAVIAVLARHLSVGELGQVMKRLPEKTP